MIGKILVIDDEQRMCLVLKAGLEVDGHQIEMAFDGNAGIKKFSEGTFDLVITDLKMPGRDGLSLLEDVKRMNPATEVILMTAYATAQTAVDAMKKGAYDYILKPFEMAELKLRVRRILEKKALASENIALKERLKERYSMTNMIGQSGAMQHVFRMIEKVAASDTTVLIRGESGTGKELVANAIHQQSLRLKEPFVAVNCGALPESLLESELFGYERGAFTGADKRKIGRFELAGKGSIFLDEIGDISTATQVKLLRVLQSKEIVRLGGTETIKIHARTIAATNRNLEELLKLGTFREDLYYRINVFPINLPALRERKDDIPLLIEHFLKKHQTDLTKIDKRALKLMMNYSWPGNVRELENILERLLIMVGDAEITQKDLPPQIYIEENSDFTFEIPEEGISLENVEKGLIHQALVRAHGNKSKAAKLLGITRRKLYSMMERLG
ncbi:sigma-54-dependent Fis family transcriptional regulator [candidate division KSB1 bacterium]|nr:sigma-54-dependent Fis family transcriptional regulator [candidate division KSB1 bacterium]